MQKVTTTQARPGVHAHKVEPAKPFDAEEFVGEIFDELFGTWWRDTKETVH